MKLYIAGPMTGYPEWNFPAFNAAAKRLRGLGHEVINPAENDGGDATAGDFAYFIRQDIQHVLAVEAIAVLPGWQKSRGATIETTIGRALNLPILDAETLEPVAEEERITNADTGGAKGRKAERMELLPWDVIEQDAQLYAIGAAKYEERNWERGYNWSLSFGALMRHVVRFWQHGESLDAEGVHHLAAVRFHAAALMRFEREHPELDDRPIRKETPA